MAAESDYGEVRRFAGGHTGAAPQHSRHVRLTRIDGPERAASHAAPQLYETMVADASDAVPPHLRLGLDEEGVRKALVLIGMPYAWAKTVKITTRAGQVRFSPHPGNIAHSPADGGDDAWVTYKRPQSMAWATKEHGRFVGRENVGGVDERWARACPCCCPWWRERQPANARSAPSICSQCACTPAHVPVLSSRDPARFDLPHSLCVSVALHPHPLLPPPHAHTQIYARTAPPPPPPPPTHPLTRLPRPAF